MKQLFHSRNFPLVSPSPEMLFLSLVLAPRAFRFPLLVVPLSSLLTSCGRSVATLIRHPAVVVSPLFKTTKGDLS